MGKRRSSKKADNKSKLGLDTGIKDTIISAVIIAGVISCACILVVLKTLDNAKITPYEQTDVWQKAFNEVEDNRVGVVFDDMYTTESEYTKLRVACNNYIETDRKSVVTGTSIDVAVKVAEDTYADKVPEAGGPAGSGGDLDGVEGVDEGVETVNVDDLSKSDNEKLVTPGDKSATYKLVNNVSVMNGELRSPIESKIKFKGNAVDSPYTSHWIRAPRKVYNTYNLEIIDLPDLISKSEPYIKADDNSMVETGPVYFDKLLMIRYINPVGELKVVSGSFSSPSADSNIVILGQGDIPDHYQSLDSAEADVVDTPITDVLDITPENNVDIINDGIHLTDNNQTAEDESDTMIDNANTINEKEYIKSISDCISKLLLARTNIDEKNALSNSLQYFTIEGKETVLNSRSVVSIEDGTTIQLTFGLAGKSDTSKSIKDRVYLQYKVVNKTSTSDVNMIVKLNSNLRIFDIDIV